MFRISELSGQTYVDTYAAKDDTPGFVSSLEADVPKRPPISVPPGRAVSPSGADRTTQKAVAPRVSVPKGRDGHGAPERSSGTVIDLRHDVAQSDDSLSS